MFVGHYGPGFIAKRIDASIPFWVLFVAAQFLDFVWAPLVLVGVEKVRIVPGFTASNPYDLYFMPYTHGFLTALFWSVIGGMVYQVVARPVRQRTSALIGLAVFSHWLLDLVVHIPDLPMYGDSAKVGLGLWNMRTLAFCLESTVLLGSMWLCLQAHQARRGRTWTLGVLMLAILAYNTFLAPPPASDRAFALMALTAAVVFTAAIWWLMDRPAAGGRVGGGRLAPGDDR